MITAGGGNTRPGGAASVSRRQGYRASGRAARKDLTEGHVWAGGKEVRAPFPVYVCTCMNLHPEDNDED